MDKSPVITWFEIPSTDYARAIRFYESVLKVSLKREEGGGVAMAVFPHEEKSTGGAVVHGPHYRPSADGVCPYLYTSELDAVLQRVPAAGGEILMPKTFCCEEVGHIAHIRDSEGNRIGLHSDK